MRKQLESLNNIVDHLVKTHDKLSKKGTSQASKSTETQGEDNLDSKLDKLLKQLSSSLIRLLKDIRDLKKQELERYKIEFRIARL